MTPDRTHTNKRTLRYALLSSLPVMAGYLVLGAGFGILLHSNGYGIWWAALMSITIYAGSMQYVAIGLLSGGATLIAAALMTLVVNVRHLFYGITMLSRYRDTGARKPYLIFSLTDETFSLVCSADIPDGVDRRQYYLFLSMLNQSYWIIGSIAGNMIGSLIPFQTAGIEFSMTALFTVIFVNQWEKNRQHLPALTGILLTLLCLILFGKERFLIPSMLLITLTLWVEKKWIKEGLSCEL